jgi:hypothetical protein
MKNRDRATPKPLPRHAPIAQAIVHLTLAERVSGERFGFEMAGNAALVTAVNFASAAMKLFVQPRCALALTGLEDLPKKLSLIIDLSIRFQKNFHLKPLRHFFAAVSLSTPLSESTMSKPHNQLLSLELAAWAISRFNLQELLTVM